MAYTVDQVKNNLTNPARSYVWQAVIPRPVGGGSMEDLLMRCQSAQLPGRSVGTIDIPWQQSGGFRIPGKLKYSHTWRVTFLENEDRRTHAALYAWQQAIVNDVTNVGLGDGQIKTDAYFILQSTKDTEILRIKLVGCFVQEIGDVDVSQGEEAPLTFTVTFAFDRWEVVQG